MTMTKRERPIGIMYRLEPRHRDALEDAARQARAARGGHGRANASAVLRALLDAWIERGAPVPKDVEP